jgi:hypothetical protein
VIDETWLGDYRHGIDEEDGIRIICLSKDGETVRFSFHYNCETNHGYTRRHEVGTVIAVSDHEITIEMTASSSKGWEDMFKDGHDDKSTARYQRSVKIDRIEDGRPVFRYENVELTYVEP